MTNEKVFSMKFSSIYPLLVSKAARKGRSREEVDQVICWLTGYTPERLHALAASDADYRTFFQAAPHMAEKASEITGKICGVTVETIEDPLMKKTRQLDKLIDELAKGKTLYQIFRTDPADYPVFEFDAPLIQNGSMDAGYVEVPFDVQKAFGKGKVPVHATFDKEPYDGQVVRMGTPCHIIGVRKEIRQKIGKTFGQTVHVTLKERPAG